MKYICKLILFAIVFLFWACDDIRLYERNVDIEGKTWHQDSIPVFSFNIDNTAQTYNFYYNFRNTRAYPYRNLYVRYALEDSTGAVISSDLHNMNLFDPVTGKPYGDGLGDIFEHQVLALREVKFDAPGEYHFKIQQYMRMNSLPEIISVGLRVEKAGIVNE
ncbi:gliding motility lipoprotein GldH [soil metagenome]